MLDKYVSNKHNILSIPIYCINLPYRSDRWILLKTQFLKFTNKIYRIHSVNHQNNIISCALSFLKCILLAKKSNLEKILICEDDITFHNDSIYIWKLAIKELPKDWDILLGGISNFDYNFADLRLFFYLEASNYFLILLYNLQDVRSFLLHEIKKIIFYLE